MLWLTLLSFQISCDLIKYSQQRVLLKKGRNAFENALYFIINTQKFIYYQIESLFTFPMSTNEKVSEPTHTPKPSTIVMPTKSPEVSRSPVPVTADEEYQDRILQKLNDINSMIREKGKGFDLSLSWFNLQINEKLLKFIKLQNQQSKGFIKRIFNEQKVKASLCSISPYNGKVREHEIVEKIYNIFTQKLWDKELPMDNKDSWNMSPPIGNFSYIMKEQIYASRIAFKQGKGDDCSIKTFAFEFYLGNSKVFTGIKTLQRFTTKQQEFVLTPNIKCDGFKIIVFDNYGNKNYTCHYGVELYHS